MGRREVLPFHTDKSVEPTQQKTDFVCFFSTVNTNRPDRDPIEFDSSTLIACLRRESGIAEQFARFRPLVRQRAAERLSPRIAGRVDPSDVVQETLLLATRRLPDFLAKRPMTFVNWLLRLTNQTVVDAHRQHMGSLKRSVKRESNDDGFSSVQAKRQLAGRAPEPPVLAEDREIHERLRRVLDQMNPLDREIIVLRDIDGLSNQDAAMRLGITTAAASKRHTRALIKLRKKTQELDQESN